MKINIRKTLKGLKASRVTVCKLFDNNVKCVDIDKIFQSKSVSARAGQRYFEM